MNQGFSQKILFVLDPNMFSTEELEAYIAWQETKKTPTKIDDWLGLGKVAHYFENEQVPKAFDSFVKEGILAAEKAYSALYDKQRDLGADEFEKQKMALQKDSLALLPSSEKLNDSIYLAKAGYSGIFARLTAASFDLLMRRTSYAQIREIVLDVQNTNKKEIVIKLEKLVGQEFSRGVNVLDKFGAWNIDTYLVWEGLFKNLELEVLAKLFPKLPCFEVLYWDYERDTSYYSYLSKNCYDFHSVKAMNIYDTIS